MSVTVEPALVSSPGKLPTQSGGYRICERCIMDTSDPEITFDESGICNHCKNYFHRVANEIVTGEAGERRLAMTVEAIKASGKGKEYDCIIGVSGGVDSTTVAYTVKRKLGLRPLAVHFDNGWNSELAVDNIHRALRALEIDLETCVVDWEEFRDLQLSFLKASVANAEIPTDHGINALLYQAAARHGVKYIIGGGNIATEGILPFSWGYFNQDLRHLKAVHRRFGSVPLRTMPQISIRDYLWYVFVRGIRIIPILNYVGYNKTASMELIQKELGWRYYGGKHYESIYTRFFQGYILPRKFGFDKRRAHLSTLVCSGEITRDAALAEMDKDPYAQNSLREDREFVLKKLGLTSDQFDEIMRLPLRTYRDYPSNAFFFHRLGRLRQVFKKIATSV